MSSLERLLRFALVCSAGAVGACGTYRPPFTQASSTGAQPELQAATVVFLWPSTSCDPGGYYTLATTDGRFVGNVSVGKQLRAALAPGEYTIVGWNELEERAGGVVVEGAVPVLHARLSAGHTYYVRMAFGEWDNRGPREVIGVRFGGGSSRRLCIAPDHSMTSAMVALTPASESWGQLPEWTAGLEAIAPDRASGQAWLDGNRDVLEAHRAVAENRFEALRPRAKRLATLESDDGVSQ